MDEFETANQQLGALTSLHDPVRKEVYDYVASQTEPVTRDGVAAALGIKRGIAARHLDRLEAEGLLRSTLKRLNGRVGPGAGRPSKLYQRSPGEVSASVPPRRYELVSELMLRAAERAPASIRQSLHHEARAEGAKVGRQLSLQAHGAGRERVLDALTKLGFEPRDAAGGGIVLGNCPFSRLAEKFATIVCAMNLEFIEGLIDGLSVGEFRARLSPHDGRCCVVLDPAKLTVGLE